MFYQKPPTPKRNCFTIAHFVNKMIKIHDNVQLTKNQKFKYIKCKIVRSIYLCESCAVFATAIRFQIAI